MLASTDPAPTLRAEGIGKEFGGVAAVIDASVEIRPGEILGIIGENGAGKSTLLKAIAGIYGSSYSGSVELGDKILKANSIREAEANGIYYVAQEVLIVPEMTVAENMFLGREPGAVVDFAKMNADAAEILARFDLDFSPEQPMKYLGVGQQQTALLGRSLAEGAAFVLFDEPTAALTGQEVDRLFDLMRRLKKDGVGSVLVTHRLDEVMDVADRVVVMRNGRVVAETPVSEASTDKLVSLMIGRDLGTLGSRVEPKLGGEVLRLENMWVAAPGGTGRRVVDDVSLSVRSGEILGLYGLVGAGRTELALAAFGAWKPPHGGDVFIDGKRTNVKNPEDAIRSGLCLLSEDRRGSGVYPTMNVSDNINIGSLDKISLGQVISELSAWRRSNRYRDELGIRASSLSMSILGLSGGNQQKALLARLLAMEPKVLILDEPTRGIDVGAKAEIFRLLNELTSEGLGIVMISSEVGEVLAMSDRISVLYKGRLSAEFKRGEASREKLLAAATGVSDSKLERQ